MWQKLALLSVAGAAGTLARFGLSGLTMRWVGVAFPWGTLAVNLLGCILFGVVWAAGQGLRVSAETRFIILTGFMGAFTTFSTFAFETGEMIAGRQWLYAGGNVLMQNLLGVAGVMAGIALGRFLWSGA